MSETAAMDAMLMTGLRATTALKVDGYWPDKWVTRKPPCEPPKRTSLSRFKHGMAWSEKGAMGRFFIWI
jgi:hypothetical protein